MIPLPLFVQGVECGMIIRDVIKLRNVKMLTEHGLTEHLGSDLDEHDGLKLLICHLRASRFGSVSSYYTRNGFHTEVELYEAVTPLQALNIRMQLFDDVDRLHVDEHRVRSGEDLARFDTLFMVRMKRGKMYSRKEIDPLACGPWEENDSQVDCSTGFKGQEVYSG